MKFGTEVHSYMLISILMFIFSKILWFIFFEQIWTQNLKFSKLTEIWYRGTFLYVYFDLNVYFFKIFVIHILAQIWFQDLKLYFTLLYADLRFWCVFSKYLPFINFRGKFHPKTCYSPYLLRFSIEMRCNSVNMEKTRWNEIFP